MRRTSAIALLAFQLCLPGPAAGGARESGAAPELLFVIPWGGDAGLTLDPGGPERPARGPGAAAVGPHGTIWILDDLAHRLAGYDRAGRLMRTMTVAPHSHDLLAVAPDGSFALTSWHLRRIELLDARGRALDPLDLPVHIGPPRGLAFSAAGLLELQNAHGERFVLGRPDAPRPWRAVLLDRRHGPPASRLECGLRLFDGRTILKQWKRPDGVEDGREPGAHFSEIDLGALASARLASVCGPETVLLEVERLLDGSRVRVSREVIRVRSGKPAGTWRMPDDWLYIPAGRFARTPSETLLIHPIADGLQVWRWRLP